MKGSHVAAGVAALTLIGGVRMLAQQTPARSPVALPATTGQTTPRPATPTRDNATPTPTVVGTAIVRGRVTASTNAQPLYRVRVALSGGVGPEQIAFTDSNGTFELKEVPAGTYAMTASRTGYLTVQYGQRQPRESGRALQVKEGETIEQVNIALFPGAVLAGRIVDQLSEPVPGAVVEVMEMRALQGRRLLLQATGPSFTNDLGEFRIGNLSPGIYYIKASTTETWPDLDPRKGSNAYAATFYPSATSAEAAQAVTLATGQEANGLDVALVVARAVRITGTLLNSKGEPIPSQPVYMDRITRTTGGGLFSAGVGGNTRSDQNGAFEFRSIPAGEYNVYSTSSETERASISPFFVTDRDIENVVLTTGRPSGLRGTIVSDEGTALPFAASRLRAVPIPLTDTGLLQPWGRAGAQTIAGDWAIRFTNIEGPHLFRLTGLPDDWMLASVTVGGLDVTDVPFDVPRAVETTGVQMTLTRKSARLAGNVLSAAGTPTADGTVVVFSTDNRRWSAGTRYVKVVRPDRQGHYSVAGLPSGTYFAVVREYVSDDEWNDPEYLRTLVTGASTLELTIGNETRADLPLTGEARR